MKYLRPLLVPCLAALLLGGCAGTDVKAYPDVPDKNLHVDVKLSVGAMTSIRSDLDIYSVNGKCEATYLGTVDLSEPGVDVGLPPGQQFYVRILLVKSPVTGGSSTSLSYATLLRPRAASSYRGNVRHVDGVVNMELFEVLPNRKQGREIPPREIKDCHAA